MNTGRLQRTLRVVEWGLYCACLFCGALAYDPANPRWNKIFLPAYIAPLLLRLIPTKVTRYIAFCASFMLIASSLLGLVSDPDYRALQPNLRRDGVTTDAHGYRVKPPVNYAQKNGTRIFAIGGSTTEEINAPDDQTWPHWLQESLRAATARPVEVINTGLSGLRVANHLATLKHIIRWQPDLVLVLAGVNDWNEHIRKQFSGAHDAAAFQGNLRVGWRNRMLAKNTVLGRALIAIKYARVQRPEALVVLDKKGSLDRPVRHSFRPADPDPEFTFFINEIGKFCRNKGVPCVFLTQPNSYQDGASEELKKTFWMTPPRQPYTLDFESMVAIARLYNQRLKQICAAKGYSCYDLAADFPASAELFVDDCHFTRAGAKRIAEKLTPEIVDMLGHGRRASAKGQ